MQINTYFSKTAKSDQLSPETNGQRKQLKKEGNGKQKPQPNRSANPLNFNHSNLLVTTTFSIFTKTFNPNIHSLLCRSQIEPSNMGKRALLVGINYPGTKAELKGCINDVNRMHKCLINRYGFAKEDIVVLIDTDPKYAQPTGVNIRRALSDLVASAEPGDFLFFHYSGHGTRLPAETGDDDDTGYDECIVPCDMNLITGKLV